MKLFLFAVALVTAGGADTKLENKSSSWALDKPNRSTPALLVTAETTLLTADGCADTTGAAAAWDLTKETPEVDSDFLVV